MRQNKPALEKRVYAVDIVRGLMMILMLLGHTRHFIVGLDYAPTDLSNSSVIYFLVRWITHIAAPAFVFLAGISIYIVLLKSRTSREVSLFLVKRGFWLILLEITLFSFFWNGGLNVIQLQVIWAIGFGFLLMSLFILFPFYVNLAVSLIILLGYSLLNNLEFDNLSEGMKIILHILYFPGQVRITDSLEIFFLYSSLPYFGIMLLGFSLGKMLHMVPERRRRIFLFAGIAMISAFILLRSINVIGDTEPWAPQSRGAVFTVLSFLNVTKYPPSLQYVLLTLGFTFILLALFENSTAHTMVRTKLFGQVAMFFYIVHLPVIRVTAKVYRIFFDTEPSFIFFLIMWFILLLVLMYICRLYAGFKMEHKSRKGYWWLRYI